MAAPQRGPLLSSIWKLHKLVWNLSRGRLGAKVAGLPVLELITMGRRSGVERSVLLSYLDHDGGYVVIASNAGDPRHPAWWHNLQSQPHAQVKIGSHTAAVNWRRVTGDERERLWSRAVDAAPAYSEYAERTDRQIPVVVLHPADG